MNIADFERCAWQLYVALEAAVPLQAMELKARGSSSERLAILAREAGQLLAEKGDVLQFGSKRKGETAEIFNALARGIAAGVMLSGHDLKLGPLVFRRTDDGVTVLSAEEAR